MYFLCPKVQLAENNPKQVHLAMKLRRTILIAQHIFIDCRTFQPNKYDSSYSSNIQPIPE